ncbi:MAG: hypothetical protein KKA12_09850 [Alphaproteobacteria bacterium]|nr:hypothetical protein [Alphaproteobacteria bacterium]
MPPMPRLLIPLILLVTLVAACERKPGGPAASAELDPAVAGALGDAIMVDPDLAGQNPPPGALTGGGPASAPIPPEDRSPEAIAAAKAEAASLVGGAFRHLPAPVQGGPSGAGETAALTARGALAGLGRGKACADRAEYTMAWAARLPVPFPVYPRGHVQEAAGTDVDGCRLRVVNYLTPVAPADVLDFYWTRARAAGFAAEHRIEGGDHVIGGSRGSAAFAVYVRSRDGLAEVDLVTSGD